MDLLGERVDFVPDPPTALMEYIRDGRLRAVAVTSESRYFALPDVPTVAESGFSGYAVEGFQGIAAPAGREQGARLHSEPASARHVVAH